MKTATSLTALAAVLSSSILASAQGTAGARPTVEPGEVDHWAPWYWTGAQSVYWHTRYHGCLAMASYGDYRNTCPQFFTRETLQRQYPGNPNVPFEVIGEWGPTEKYKSEGFMVKVHEMNKILMVFKGIHGWENFNATLAPLLGVGCDRTCMAHAGAIEAWEEVKAATNDMQIIKSSQGDLVWSASGHGFGGMIMQVAALDLKARGLLFSAQSFGSAPVFNTNAARRWDDLFISDASQRTVANNDAVPAKIPYQGKYMPDGTISNSSYAFVNTGIHVWQNSSITDVPMGNSNMYGQNYVYCLYNNQDPRCSGGDNEADHYFYFTHAGECCESHADGWQATYNATWNREALRQAQAEYNATATAPLLEYPILTATTTEVTSTSTSSSEVPTSTVEPAIANTTATPTATPTPGAGALANASPDQAAATQSTGAGFIGKESSMVIVGLSTLIAGLVALF